MLLEHQRGTVSSGSLTDQADTLDGLAYILPVCRQYYFQKAHSGTFHYWWRIFQIWSPEASKIEVCSWLPTSVFANKDYQIRESPKSDFACSTCSIKEMRMIKKINGWKSIDRGGLTRVNNNTYEVFHAMECEIRRYCLVSSCLTKDLWQRLYWRMNTYCFFGLWLAVPGNRAALLELIVKEWLKIRGFSVTSPWRKRWVME